MRWKLYVRNVKLFKKIFKVVNCLNWLFAIIMCFSMNTDSVNPAYMENMVSSE